MMPDLETLTILATWAMLVVGLAWWPCGACVVCEIGTDNFNRASLGSGWTETSGTWTISSNAVQTTDANGILLFNAAGSGPDMRVQAAFQATATGDRARVIAAYTDANNYLFADAVLNYDGVTGVTSIGTMRLYSRSGGVDTLLGTNTFGAGGFTAAVLFHICYTGDVLQCYSQTTFIVARNITGFTGTKAAIGTGVTVTGTVSADDFLVEKTTGSTRCNPCVCNCPYCGGAGTTHPCEMEVTITSVGDDACATCEDVNATYVLVRRHQGIGEEISCAWQAPSTACAFTRVIASVTVSILSKRILTISVLSADNTKFLRWRNADTGTTCAAWNAESVPYYEQSVAPNNDCDASSSTCEVTSV